MSLNLKWARSCAPVLALGFVAVCSPAEKDSELVAAMGAGGSGLLASGGQSAGSAGAPLSPASGGAGGAQAMGGNAGSGGVSSGGNDATAGSGGAAAREPFVCNQVIGLTLTREWYEQGDFESGVDADRWQMKAAQSAYVVEWANPDSSYWDTPLYSPCAENSSAPDRVVLVVLSWTIMEQADWEEAIGGAVDTISAKYPELERIELMSIIRGPQNQSCGDPNVYAENTHIPEPLDQAFLAIAARSPELVVVAPQFAVDACSDYQGVGPHLTAAGNSKIAAKVAAHYAANP